MQWNIFTLVRWLILAAVLSVFHACVKTPATPEPKEPQTLTFNAYLSRDVATRAGDGGVIDNTSLRQAGFGVFAYHTENALYGPDITPNFMYNIFVSNLSGSNWEYFPIRYWPNEEEDSALGAAVNRVSFFAYAPHVDVDPLTGRVTSGADTTGILQLTTSIDKNGPKVTYRSSFIPDSSVDLCWGLPHLNLQRPTVTTPVSFQFYHALSSLNMQIDAAIDEISPGSINRDDDTRIYVRYVTIAGCALRGVLNLNNETLKPDWSGFSGESLSLGSVTVHDGRLDGLEAKYEDSDESPTGLNQGVIQMNYYNYRSGVTNSLRNLFDTIDSTKPVFVIPTGYPLAVTIEYDIETKDDSLSSSHLSDGTTHGSVTTVRVRQPIAISSDPLRLEAGKKYVIRMHLGMTSVKFEAGMSDRWVEDNEVINLYPVTMGQEVVIHTATDGGWS